MQVASQLTNQTTQRKRRRRFAHGKVNYTSEKEETRFGEGMYFKIDRWLVDLSQIECSSGEKGLGFIKFHFLVAHFWSSAASLGMLRYAIV